MRYSLETGLGGRCDATKCHQKCGPLLRRFRSTIWRCLATQRRSLRPKAGIFKPGTAVVRDGQPNDVQQVPRRACDAAGAVCVRRMRTAAYWVTSAVRRLVRGAGVVPYHARKASAAECATAALRALNALRERGCLNTDRSRRAPVTSGRVSRAGWNAWSISRRLVDGALRRRGCPVSRGG